MKDLCNSGVAASRQRAALFNLLEKCGGLPTAATMKVKDEGRMMNDETSKRMEIGAPVPAAPTCLGEAVRRRKLPSEGWSGTACSIDYELRAVPEAGAPGGSATCYPQSSISHSRFSRIQAVEKPFYHGWTQMNPARLMPQPQILDCGGNPAEREPRRFWKQPAARKAVSPLSTLRSAATEDGRSATAVQIFVVRARSCRIVLRINRSLSNHLKVGRVTSAVSWLWRDKPCAPWLAFLQAAGRGLPALPFRIYYPCLSVSIRGLIIFSGIF